MSYTTDGIQYIGAFPYDLGLVLRAKTDHADKVIQAYVSGRLVAWAWPENGTVQFVLPDAGGTDFVFLLAVDPDQAAENYFREAFPAAGSYANRIEVRTPQTICPYAPGDEWQVFRGDAGDDSAAICVHSQDFYPGGIHAGGLGAEFGNGGFGYDGADAAGLGHNFGYGEFGFDCHMLTWVSQPLPPGTYPIRVLAEDARGNQSAAFQTSVTIETYARPAGNLAVESYTASTDTLQLSFTPSEDIA